MRVGHPVLEGCLVKGEVPPGAPELRGVVSCHPQPCSRISGSENNNLIYFD